SLVLSSFLEEDDLSYRQIIRGNYFEIRLWIVSNEVFRPILIFQYESFDIESFLLRLPVNGSNRFFWNPFLKHYHILVEPRCQLRFNGLCHPALGDDKQAILSPEFSQQLPSFIHVQAF